MHHRLRSTLTAALAVPLAIMSIPMSISSAQATSFTSVPDHEASLACASVTKTLDAMTAGGDRYAAMPLFLVHDDFGTVDADTYQAFLAAVTTSDGKRDRVPMELTALYRINKDPTEAVYVAHVKRVRWRLIRYVENGMLDFDPVDDPHWSIENDYWMISFAGNNLYEMRQGRFLYLSWAGKRVDKKCVDPVMPVTVDMDEEE